MAMKACSHNVPSRSGPKQFKPSRAADPRSNNKKNPTADSGVSFVPFTSAIGIDARQPALDIFAAARATAHRYTAYSKSHQKSSGTVLDVRQEGSVVAHASVINIDLLPPEPETETATVFSPQVLPPTDPDPATENPVQDQEVAAVPVLAPEPEPEDKKEEDVPEIDVKNQPLDSLVFTLRSEIDILNIFIDDIMQQLKDKDEKLGKSEQKYADLKKEYDRLAARGEKENNGLQKNCRTAAPQPSKEGPLHAPTLPSTLVTSPKCGNSVSKQVVAKTRTPHDTNLPMSFREHTKKKMLLNTNNNKSGLDQIRRSIGCDGLGPESAGKKKLMKSTSMAWIVRGGHGKQPTQLEETASVRKVSVGGYKSARESPCKHKLHIEDYCPDNHCCSGEYSLADSCGESRPEIDKKDYSISSIEQELLKQIEKVPLGCMDQSSLDQSSGDEKFKEFITKCPYIEQLRQTSEKYRTVIVMLKALAKYNDLMKRMLEANVCIKNETETEKYSEFLKKNRNLRIEIKSLLSEQKECQKKIEELKRSINVFGIHPRLSQTYELEQLLERKASANNNNPTKRELIKFRDYLLDENDKLLFQLKRRLL